MKHPWFCLDCNYPRELSTHGRCCTCDSDSVVSTSCVPRPGILLNIKREVCLVFQM
jgi:hypothetical protein